MKNVKAYVRTTLTAGLILAAAVLGAAQRMMLELAADTAAASSGTDLLLPPMLPILIRRSSNTEKLPVRTLSYLRMPSKPILEKRAIHSPGDFSEPSPRNDLALNDGEIGFQCRAAYRLC